MIAQLKSLLDQKHSELEEIDKNQMSLDHDMLRIKIINELES